jgi:integrase
MTKTKYPGVYARESVGNQETGEGQKIHKGKPDQCFYITYKLEGKKVWEKVGWVSDGYSAKLAADIKVERLRAKRHGQELPKQKLKAPLFKDLAGKYLTWAKTNKTRDGRDDESNYNNHLAERFDNKRLNEISTFDLEKMKSDLLKEKMAPASVKHCLVLFRQMFNKALVWGMYSGTNPIKGVKIPSPQNQRERFLSYEEADHLLKELAGVSKQVQSMALLSLQTGMRAGEIFNLRGQDLDFENDLINIMDPKNKQARKVHMTAGVKAMLSVRIPKNSTDLIFPDRKGKKGVQVSHAFDRAVDRLEFNKGVKDRRHEVTFHTLRHTFASWLALQGTPIFTISQLLGHKSLTMTARYSHLSPDHKRDAVQGIERIFNEKRQGKVISIKE